MGLRNTLFAMAAVTMASASAANAAPGIDASVGRSTPSTQYVMPFANQQLDDCTTLLAVRLSRMENTNEPALPDCSQSVFTQSPPLSAFDCTGRTANECAALYQANPAHAYMDGGWSSRNELWYLPLRDDLPGDNLCLDGTRQLAYADSAVAWQCSTDGSQCETDSDCGTGVCEVHDIESNDWVFYTQGGANCGSGQECLDQYLEGSATMTSLNAPYSHDGGGILSDDARNPFHGYNRVRLKKCNKDGFMGNTTRPVNSRDQRPNGISEGVHFTFDLYFHGVRTWLAAFATLKDGVPVHAEFHGACQQSADCGAGGVCVNEVSGKPVNMCRYDKSLPPLSAAADIVLVGWSGGSMALAHSGDRLVESLTGTVQPLAPNATVSLAYDAPWKPALDSDTAFWLGGRNMYLVTDDLVPTVDNPGYLPPDEDLTDEYGADTAFSKATFMPGGLTRETFELWGAVYDESCADMHGLDDWHCFERNHVLANHVSAPVFTRMAQRDSSGTDSPGSKHLHSMEACKADQSEENCYDWVDEDFRQRAFQQSTDFYRHFETLGEEGAGAPARGAFASDSTKHNGFEDPDEFFYQELMQCRDDGAELRSTTLSGALHDWLQTGQRVGAIEWREGVTFGDGYLWVSKADCSRCPSVIPGEHFARDDMLDEWDLGVCSKIPGT